MKKLLLVVLVLAFALVPVCSSFAAGVDGWEVGSGYVIDGKSYPMSIAQNAEGLVFGLEKGYYGGDGVASGAWMTDQIDISDGLTVKFRFDVTAGEKINDDGSYDSSDNWFGICVLDSPGFPDVVANSSSKGLFTLVRATYANWGQAARMVQVQPGIANEGLDIKDGNFSLEADPTSGVVTFKLVKDGGKYDVYAGFNDGDLQLVTTTTQLDLDPVLNGKAYLSFGLSNNWAVPMQVTVLEVNGQSMAAAPVTEAPTDDPVVTKKPDASTGTAQDYTWAIVLGSLAAVLAVAGAAVLVNKSRKTA